MHQEYTALIKYIQVGKENDTDWFQIESNKEGTVWSVFVLSLSFSLSVCVCLKCVMGLDPCLVVSSPVC